MGELDPSNVGIAAPIVSAEGDVHESLVLILSETRYQTADKPLLLQTVKAAAAQISKQIANEGFVDEHGFPLAASSR